MKRIALALALGALSTTAALAASGDAWYGNGRGDIVIVPATPYTYVEPAPAPPDGVTVYYDEPVTTAPVIVERRYVTEPSDVVVVESPPYDDRGLFHVEPRKYGTVYNGGLFPRKGPNDFGQ
jgi:hypothetical protein